MQYDNISEVLAATVFQPGAATCLTLASLSLDSDYRFSPEASKEFTSTPRRVLSVMNRSGYLDSRAAVLDNLDVVQTNRRNWPKR